MHTGSSRPHVFKRSFFFDDVSWKNNAIHVVIILTKATVVLITPILFWDFFIEWELYTSNTTIVKVHTYDFCSYLSI